MRRRRFVQAASDLSRSRGYMLRAGDEVRVLAAASEAEPVRLHHIVQQTGLSRPIVGGHVRQLVAKGLLWQAKVGAATLVHCKPVAASRRIPSTSQYALHVAESRRIFKVIQECPGIWMRELARRVGLGASQTAAYVAHLEALHIVATRTWRNRTAIWVGLAPGDWKRRLLFADERFEELLRFIQTHKRAPQSNIIDHAKTNWNWPRSTTQFRLQQLEDAGLIRARPGRQRTYSVPQRQRLPRVSQ